MRILFVTLVIFTVFSCSQENERISPKAILSQESRPDDIVKGKQKIIQDYLPLFHAMVGNQALLGFAKENHLEFTIRDASIVEFSSGISDQAVFVDLGNENGIQASFVSFINKNQNLVTKAFYVKASSSGDNNAQVEINDLNSGRAISTKVASNNLELASIFGAYQVKN